MSASRTWLDAASLLYVVRGELDIAGTNVPALNLAELTGGDSVAIEATKDTMFVLGHAAPINEPVVAHGPFVMTTADEIRQAYADYRAGRFNVPAGD
jgi:quercetin 2,3-dioxygenase